MANITQLTEDGLLSQDWQTINQNFNELNDKKPDKATTLAGYGIEDALTEAEIEAALSAKANFADVSNELAGKLDKSGGTVSGKLTINKGRAALVLRETNDMFDTYIEYKDKADNRRSVVNAYTDNSNRSVFLIRTQAPNGKNADLTIFVDDNGNGYATCPTPATTDNSTKIATTAWVRNNTLTLEEIKASTKLTNEIASAEALKASMDIDTLWTNAYPTETIGFDVNLGDYKNKYRFLAIEFRSSTNLGEYNTNIFPTSISMGTLLSYGVMGGGEGVSAGVVFIARFFVAGQNSISFYNGAYVGGASVASSQNSKIAIPTKIMGVR